MQQENLQRPLIEVKKKSWKFLGGGGGCSKTLKNRNSRGWSSKVKKHPWQGYEYFLEPHIPV